MRRALKSILMSMWKYNAKGNPKCNKWDRGLCNESSKDTPTKCTKKAYSSKPGSHNLC